MKKNIHRVNYNARETPDGEWWMWEERCDRCGKLTTPSNIMYSKSPDMGELDFCIDCYRYLMDNKISYKNAYEMYKLNKPVVS